LDFENSHAAGNHADMVAMYFCYSSLQPCSFANSRVAGNP
jgi:hypothetical protein